MSTILNLLKDYLPFLIWIILFSLGGIWLIQSSFNLRKNEQAVAGVGLGIVLQIWLGNILAQVIPFTTAIMASAVMIFIAGLGFSLKRIDRKPLKLLEIPVQPLQWLALVGLAYLFIRLGRGLAILVHAPARTLLAAGLVVDVGQQVAGRLFGAAGDRDDAQAAGDVGAGEDGAGEFEDDGAAQAAAEEAFLADEIVDAVGSPAGKGPVFGFVGVGAEVELAKACLLYTSPSPRDS